MPKISYLITTKNRGDIIKDTLESLITQTEKDWEAIIVDDHGNDNTGKIIQKYKDQRFKYFRLTDFHGLGASCGRNFAAVRASSDLIAIIDSDDICYPGRTKVILNAFKNDSDIDVFFSDIDIWEEKTGVIRDRKTLIEPFSVERLLEVNFIPHSTVAMRRQILLDNPYNQFFRIAEDYELLTRLAVGGRKFAYSKEKLVKYRLGETNISSGGRGELTKKYDLLVKMFRRKVIFDHNLLNEISILESKLSK